MVATNQTICKNGTLCIKHVAIDTFKVHLIITTLTLRGLKQKKMTDNLSTLLLIIAPRKPWS